MSTTRLHHSVNYLYPTENWKINIAWIGTENVISITMYPLEVLDLQIPNIYALFRCVMVLVLSFYTELNSNGDCSLPLPRQSLMMHHPSSNLGDEFLSIGDGFSN
jgi:hypothetical protein